MLNRDLTFAFIPSLARPGKRPLCHSEEVFPLPLRSFPACPSFACSSPLRPARPLDAFSFHFFFWRSPEAHDRALKHAGSSLQRSRPSTTRRSAFPSTRLVFSAVSLLTAAVLGSASSFAAAALPASQALLLRAVTRL